MTRQFRLWASSVNVDGVNAELAARPELWDANAYRTHDETSPHHGIPDIWLRWRAPEDLRTPMSYSEPHFPVFWPAWRALPSLHSIVRDLAHLVGATQWGGILLTETPPGKQVKPHVDSGWHARFYDRKLYLTLASNPWCLNHCGDDTENFRVGDVWEYPNNIVHSVVNNGTTPHRNVIICFRSMDRDTAETL